MVKKKNIIFIIFLLMSCAFAFLACNNKTNTPQYKVEFMVDSEVYYTITTNGKEEITLPNNPAKAFNIFGGWYTDNGTWNKQFSYNTLTTKPITADLKVYAKWSDSFKYNLINSATEYSVAVADETTFSGTVIIPDSYKGLPVTAIASHGFCNNDSVNRFAKTNAVTSFIIPNNITSIGDFAFSDCVSLISITLPNSIKNIGEGAFYNCSAITTITIPSGVKNICDAVFYGCKKLANVTLSPATTSIGDFVFFGCSGLTSITIPDTVIGIGNGAFYGCSGLTSITIPDSVLTIGEQALLGCSALESITVKSGNAIYKSEGDCLIEISTQTVITGCQNSDIHNGITKIDDWAFYGCYYLTSVTIPSTVTDIGRLAFYGCYNLTSLKIPIGMENIGELAFWNCDRLTIYAAAISSPIGWHINWNNSDRPVFWDITESNFTEIDGAQYILQDGSAVLTRYVGNADTFVIPIFVAIDGTEYDVASIGDRAFAGNNSLISVTLSATVTNISSGAFSECYSLTNIIIPNSVMNIESSAFAYCNRLTVYVELTSFYNNWDIDWNLSNRPVIFNCTLSDEKSYILLVTISKILNAENSISAPYREDYIFGGWTTVPESTVAEYTAGGIINADDGVILYAIWIAK